MHGDEKKLEGKKNASSDVITSSLCLSRDTDLVTWYTFNYGGHVIRIQLWRNRVLNRSFHQKTTTIYYSTPIFNWQEEIQQLVCWPEELDDKWSQKSASFCRCRSCDFTDLYTTTGKQIPKCDRFTWQEVMSFLPVPVLFRLPVESTSDEFYRYQSAQTTGGCCSCGKPLQWLPVISLFDPGTSTRGLPLVWRFGYRFQSCSCEACQETPLQWFPVMSPCWYWNLHQRPFHWCECWGTGSSHVPVKPVKKPPSVVSSDQPFFDTGISTRGLSTGVTVGGTRSSLVQTTGEAAQRVHLPEVAVTIVTLISPVQIFGPVPVLFRLPVGSLASLWWGISAPVLLRLPVVVTEIQQGLPVTQDYRLHRVAGGEIQQGYWLRRIAGSGTGVLPVLEPECCWLQRNLLFPSLLARNQPQIQCWQQVHGLQRFPGLQRIEGDKLVGQEVSSLKFL